jgi:predicted GNAT family acetyltransferase
MTRYFSITDATDNGFTFQYDADGSRFQLIRDSSQVGVAHFSDFGELIRDFDHTVVDPQFRGTGLSNLLAEYALTHETTVGRRLAASCWFIQGVFKKHPEVRDSEGVGTGVWNHGD